ncbi:MAG TPA: 2TM domain-containing protein [Dehalococcoidales bacterium]|nr:2TM domain-containing protein [Dehalococcoidales bacterium]
MTMKMTEEQIYEEAKLRVKAKKDFYGHLSAWVIVNVILIIVWALSWGGYPWFLWPLCIWGIFVVIHGLRTFVFERKSDRAAIEKEVENIKREQG